MILVILGTQDKPFVRLLQAVETLVQQEVITDRIIVQAGMTKYSSELVEVFDLIPSDQFNNLINQADLIITHGGVGSIITALKNKKKVIAVARLKEYGEHTNNHQVQIIEKFVSEGYILGISDTSLLIDSLISSKTFKPKEFNSNSAQVINIIRNYINNLKKH